MYEFVQTETGWRVFWGIDPIKRQTIPCEFVLTKEQAPVMLPLDHARRSQIVQSLALALTTESIDSVAAMLIEQV